MTNLFHSKRFEVCNRLDRKDLLGEGPNDMHLLCVGAELKLQKLSPVSACLQRHAACSAHRQSGRSRAMFGKFLDFLGL